MNTPVKRGRPPLDPSGAQQAVRVRLTPAEQEYFRRVAGSVNAAIRILTEKEMASKTLEKQGKKK